MNQSFGNLSVGKGDQWLLWPTTAVSVAFTDKSFNKLSAYREIVCERDGRREGRREGERNGKRTQWWREGGGSIMGGGGR